MASYIASQTATFTVRFTRNGSLYDPYAVGSVRILDPSSTVMATITPTRLSLGIYSITYTIPAAGPAGQWHHAWSYTGAAGMASDSFQYAFDVVAASYVVTPVNAPISALIFANVVTTLRGITLASGYNQTVAKVEEYRPLDMPSPGTFPTIHAWIENESRDQSQINYTDHHQILVIRGFTMDGNDPNLALERLMADIERALAADLTRGGYAVDTAAVGAVEREAIMGAGQAGRGIAYAEYEIWFRTKRGNPYSQ
jgi:hypothetical protein